MPAFNPASGSWFRRLELGKSGERCYMRRMRQRSALVTTTTTTS
jgi:hypothetical protein